MANCPKCWMQLSENNKFCPQCGGVISSSPQQQQEQTPAGSTPKNFLVKLENFFTANKIIAAVAVVVIILAGGALFFLISRSAGPLTQTKKTVSPTETVEVALEKASVKISQGAVTQDTEVSVKKFPAQKAPAPSKDAKVASDYYEFGPDGLTFADDKPSFVTLPFDPAGLSEEQLETVHIATYQDGKWVSLEGSLVDTTNNTVSAPVTHFSGFWVQVYEKVGQAAEAVFSDVIEAKISFSDLPTDIQQALESEYEPGAIKSAIYWKVSHASKVASATILGANLISKITDLALTVSDLAISALEEGEEALEYAIGILAAETISEEILSQAAGEEVGSVVFTLYEAGKIGKEVYKEGAKVLKKTGKLQVEIAALILRKEMEYINANVWQGIAKLWQLNPTSASRLQVYLITVEGKNKRTGFFDKGVKYFYLNDDSGRYEVYQDSYVSRKMEVKAAVVPTSTPSATGGPTPTLKPAALTATPTPTMVTATAPTVTPTTAPAPTVTPTPAAAEEVTSTFGSIASFAEDWSWSKERNQDGKYGETKVTLDLGGKSVQSATLTVSGSYSQQAGAGSAVVYISASQQVTPTDTDHNKGSYWYGNSISAGTQAGTFSCTYSGATSSYDITSFLQQNSSANTFYITVQNNSTADIGISSIQISATVQ